MAIILENRLAGMIGVNGGDDFEFCGYIDGTNKNPPNGGEAALTPKSGRNPPYSLTITDFYGPQELKVPDNQDYKFVVQVSETKIR